MPEISLTGEEMTVCLLLCDLPGYVTDLAVACTRRETAVRSTRRGWSSSATQLMN